MQSAAILQTSQRLRRAEEFEVPVVGSRIADDRVKDGGSDGVCPIRVAIESDADVVLARQQGRALAVAMRFSSTDSAFIATTVSELARALLSHTVRGEIWLDRVDEHERSGVVIMARDPIVHDGWNDGHDPSNSDFALPNVCRLVDEFDVASEAGHGTTIRAAKWCRRR